MADITKSSIQEKIAGGHLEQSISEFRDLVTAIRNSNLERNLILISARYNRLDQQIQEGTISDRDAQTEMARITSALLEFLKDVPDDAIVPGRGIEIVRKPNNPSASQTTANPATGRPEAAQPMSGLKKILFMAANPVDTNRLRTDEEARNIQEGLRLAENRDHFEFITKLAVRVKDMRRAIMDESPNIVHFSGHGGGEAGLIFENENGESKLVSSTALASLFSLFSDTVECVVLNACYSEEQADAIVQHIPYVIGMDRAIPDRTAIEFAVAFYDALGNGRGTEFAFNYARTAVELEGLSGNLIPQLKKKNQPS